MINQLSPAAGLANDQYAGRGGADISNWRTAPFSQWAFRNVREFIPCADIDPASVPSLPLTVQPRSLEQFSLAAGEGVPLSLTQFHEATATQALVILLDGNVVHEFYDHGMTATSRHILMSGSKSIVGLVAGQLESLGALDLERLVTDLVPEVADTAYRGATLRHLLDMRTGVVLDADELRAYDAATNWEPLAPGEPATDLRTFFAKTRARTTPHGGAFSYISANTDLLGWAIERATGKTFAALVSELLWIPMGAEHGAYITVDRGGLPRCTGGICATARDFARIGQLIVDGGRGAGHTIVSPTWIDDVYNNGDREAWANGELASVFMNLKMSYRSGWYVFDDEPRTMFASGAHGQHLFVDRTNRLVIAKLSVSGSATDFRAAMLTHLAVAEFRRCLLA